MYANMCQSMRVLALSITDDDQDRNMRSKTYASSSSFILALHSSTPEKPARQKTCNFILRLRGSSLQASCTHRGLHTAKTQSHHPEHKLEISVPRVHACRARFVHTVSHREHMPKERLSGCRIPLHCPLSHRRGSFGT